MMMTMETKIRQQNKNCVWEMFHALANAPQKKIADTLRLYYAEEAVWEIFHPFNTLHGCQEAVQHFWQPLFQAIPNLERRLDIFAGSVYQDHYWVTCMGYLYGNFENPWLGIPATKDIVYLRMGEFHQVEKGKISKTHLLLDIPDVMRQAGFYPFRPMMGASGLVFGPQKSNGLRLGEDDLQQKTLNTVLSMHKALHEFDGKDVNSMPQDRYWSENFLYFAPAGIGTTRGLNNFKKKHQQPFLQSFPDRQGSEHYCRISDGPIACTSHWGTLTGTHLGAEWLGLPATGKKITMRVADWYCASEEGKLYENWLLLDILDMYQQMGFDVLANLANRLQGN